MYTTHVKPVRASLIFAVGATVGGLIVGTALEVFHTKVEAELVRYCDNGWDEVDEIDENVLEQIEEDMSEVYAELRKGTL